MAWLRIKDMYPPQDVIIDTRIDDLNGIRNQQQLILSGNLWWLPNKSMYIYYSPTHWRYPVNTSTKKD